MSFINITTNNLTRQLKNSTTIKDNWVYVPGNTVTGDYTKPYAISSLNDFKAQFGDSAVEGSKTYDYVCGLLSAGLPVIFQRIACEDKNVDSPGVTKAEMTLKTTNATDDSEIEQVKITEKYGGTYGNEMKITIRDTGSAIWVDVYYKYTKLETKKLLSYNTSTETQTAINTRLIANIQSEEYAFEHIDIRVLNTDAATFSLPTITNKKFDIQGTDFSESKVAAQIPGYLSDMEDRLLWQPKFITSGGYTDNDISGETPIAEAMKNLTLVRQDCRAIIDAPQGTPLSDYKSLATKLAYQQLSDNQTIPSAAMYGPWQYMQVGSNMVWMPPSYAFLIVLANDLTKGKKVYTPKAGLLNGVVPGIIRPEREIGSDIIDDWQKESEAQINPIVRLQGGEYVIFGNSTLLLADNVTGINNAFAESSADLTIIEIRRYVYNIATELQYQYNSVESFETFAISVSKFLDTMKTEGAVYDYTITDMSSDADPRTLKINLDVSLSPTIKNIEIYLNVSYGSIEMSTGGAE